MQDHWQQHPGLKVNLGAGTIWIVEASAAKARPLEKRFSNANFRGRTQALAELAMLSEKGTESTPFAGQSL
jgi:hypothetical protein